MNSSCSVGSQATFLDYTVVRTTKSRHKNYVDIFSHGISATTLVRPIRSLATSLLQKLYVPPGFIDALKLLLLCSVFPLRYLSVPVDLSWLIL